MHTKKIGLALGGGAARGLAHIGVLKVLEKAGLKIDFIAGTSMGALIGGLYAATLDIDFIEKTFSYIAEKFAYPRFHLSLHKNLLFKNQDKVEEILSKPVANLKIEDLKIPFIAIATNAENGEEVILRKGNLKEAIKASAAIPFVFESVKIDGKVLIDGGFSNPTPVDRVKEMGAEFVIGVDILRGWPNLVDLEKKETGFSLKHIKMFVTETYHALEFQISKEKMKCADLIIKPPLLDYNWNDFYYASEIIQRGVNETEKYIDAIRKSTGYPKPSKKPLENLVDFISGGSY